MSSQAYKDVKRADKIGASVTSDDVSEAWELAKTWSEFTDGDTNYDHMSTTIEEAIDLIRRSRQAITAVVKAYNSGRDESIKELMNAMSDLEAFAGPYEADPEDENEDA